jgi:hypothetical protein
VVGFVVVILLAANPAQSAMLEHQTRLHHFETLEPAATRCESLRHASDAVRAQNPVEDRQIVWKQVIDLKGTLTTDTPPKAMAIAKAFTLEAIEAAIVVLKAAEQEPS